MKRKTERKNSSNVIESLRRRLGDSAEACSAMREEEIRIALTDTMRRVREASGLTQQQLANRLGVGQSWVSRLESANYDHRVESVTTYFAALDAELVMAVRRNNVTYPVGGFGDEGFDKGWAEAPLPVER